MWGQHRHRCHPPVPPQGVLPPPLPSCPSIPRTPPKTKASLWPRPTGSLPATFFACFLSAMGAPAPWSAPPPPADSGAQRCPCSAALPGVLPQLPALLWVDLGQERKALGAQPRGCRAIQGRRVGSIHQGPGWSGLPHQALMFSSIKMGEITATLWGCQADEKSPDTRLLPATQRRRWVTLIPTSALAC